MKQRSNTALAHFTSIWLLAAANFTPCVCVYIMCHLLDVLAAVWVPYETILPFPVRSNLSILK